jgi:hypothetical protein
VGVAGNGVGLLNGQTTKLDSIHSVKGVGGCGGLQSRSLG